MKSRRKLICFVLLIVTVLLLDRAFGWSERLAGAETLHALTEMVENHLWIALAVYLGATVIGCVVLALPGATFALLAGVLFGPWLGSLACLVATTIGASAAFLVGRFFLRDSFRPIAERNRYLKKLLFDDHSQRDVVVLMITRLVPLFPYNLQNFAYGITDIGFWKYTICTFLFMGPGVAFFTIGAAGLTAQENRMWYFAGAGILFLLVMGLGAVLRRRYLGRQENPAAEREA